MTLGGRAAVFDHAGSESCPGANHRFLPSVSQRISIARRSHRMWFLSHGACVPRIDPSHAMRAENRPILQFRAIIIASRYNYEQSPRRHGSQISARCAVAQLFPCFIDRPLRIKIDALRPPIKPDPFWDNAREASHVRSWDLPDVAKPHIERQVLPGADIGILGIAINDPIPRDPAAPGSVQP